MRRHGDEVNVVGAHELDDLVRGLPHRQHTVDGKAFVAQLRGPELEIGSIHFDFLAFREIELLEVSCDPAISDVHEQKTRAGHSGQRFDVIQDRLICGAVLDGDKDGAIHSCPLTCRQPKEAVERFADRLGGKGVKEQLHVERYDDGCCCPPEDLDPSRIDELSHFGLLSGKSHQRPDRETELHTQDNLTRHQQVRRLAFAVESDDADSRNNRDPAGNQSPHPRSNSKVQKTFHDNLAGERAGERRVLARRQQGERKQRACHTYAQGGTQQSVGILNFRDILVPRPVKSGSGKDQNGAH